MGGPPLRVARESTSASTSTSRVRVTATARAVATRMPTWARCPCPLRRPAPLLPTAHRDLFRRVTRRWIRLPLIPTPLVRGASLSLSLFAPLLRVPTPKDANNTFDMSNPVMAAAMMKSPPFSQIADRPRSRKRFRSRMWTTYNVQPNVA